MRVSVGLLTVVVESVVSIRGVFVVQSERLELLQLSGLNACQTLEYGANDLPLVPIEDGLPVALYPSEDTRVQDNGEAVDVDGRP